MAATIRSCIKRTDARFAGIATGMVIRPPILLTNPAAPAYGSCESKITYIDGDEGVLLYRGYPIEELAEHSDFMEVSYLLLYGELPTAPEKKKFERDITIHT